jgi:hypothetical protein
MHRLWVSAPHHNPTVKLNLTLLQCFLSVCSLLLCVSLNAEEPAVAEAQAPPNHVMLHRVRGAVYYIAKPLKERRDVIQAQMISISATSTPHNPKIPDANPQFHRLQQELVTLDQEIEMRKVLVSPLTIHQREETGFFDLGPKKRLIITADQVQLHTWDGPQVKCVLIKNVLTTANEQPETHLEEMRVMHLHSRADPQMVGKTDAQVAAEEKEYLASPKGQARDKTTQALRLLLQRETAAKFAEYRDFRGYEIDTLTIEGLLPEKGNRQLAMRTKSEGGDEHLGSEWQRQAKLIVSVPPGCNAIAVRGCLAGIDVQGLNSDLSLTDDDAHARDYAGRFQVCQFHGKLRIRNVPLQLIENIAGDINIIHTEELANAETSRERGLRVSSIPPAGRSTIRHVAGNLTAWFARSNLTISDVFGKIDVTNDFGDTVFRSMPTMTAQGHRIISQSGNIEATLSTDPLKMLRIYALTNHGTVSTDVTMDRLESVSFSTYDTVTNTRRHWRGLASPRNESPENILRERQDRPAAVLQDAWRHAGLDLISRGGNIRVMLQD